MSSDMSRINKNITLKDIAASTGFTVNTVSRALNDKEDISEATKVLIRQKADELGYIKNTLAGSLRSKRTKTLAVIVGDISNPFFGILVKEIEISARLRGYTTIIFSTEENSALEELAIRSVLEKNVDGIILCPEQQQAKTVLLLQKLNFPFVLIGRYFDSIKCDYIIADDQKGGYDATQYLIQNGHRDILFLNGPEYISSARLRLKGYTDALSESDIPIHPHLIKEISIANNNLALIQDYLKSGHGFTAVLAFSDMIALETVHTFISSGYQSDDIEIIGFDNIQTNLQIPYPLTTIHYDKQKMAQLSVNALLDRIADPDHDPVNVILDTELVVRDSL